MQMWRPELAHGGRVCPICIIKGSRQWDAKAMSIFLLQVATDKTNEDSGFRLRNVLIRDLL